MENMFCAICGDRVGTNSFTHDGKNYCVQCAPLHKETPPRNVHPTKVVGPDEPTGEFAPVSEPAPSHGVTKFYFCETCGKRITDKQILEGLGRDKKLKGIFCKTCAVGVTTQEFDAISEVELRKPVRKSGGNATLLNKIPSGDFKPPSGSATPMNKIPHGDSKPVRHGSKIGMSPVKRAESHPLPSAGHERSSNKAGFSPLIAAIAGVGTLIVLGTVFLIANRRPQVKANDERTVVKSNDVAKPNEIAKPPPLASPLPPETPTKIATPVADTPGMDPRVQAAFKGKILSYAANTKAITVAYDFSTLDQLQDFEITLRHEYNSVKWIKGGIQIANGDPFGDHLISNRFSSRNLSIDVAYKDLKGTLAVAFAITTSPDSPTKVFVTNEAAVRKIDINTTVLLTKPTSRPATGRFQAICADRHLSAKTNGNDIIEYDLKADNDQHCCAIGAFHDTSYTLTGVQIAGTLDPKWLEKLSQK